jgi:hypothetical protein
MNRVFGIVSAMLLGLLIHVPVASAADPIYEDGRVVVSVRGDITFPAGQRADSLVVVDGKATIEGDVRTLVVINGTANLVGSHTEEIVAIASRVTLDGSTVVAGDVRVISTTVEKAPGATIQGATKEGLDLAGAALFVGPALFLLYLGFVIAAMAAALVLAGLASRQVRSAEVLISSEPATTFLAGLAGLFGIILGGTLAIVTIVGIPLGLGIFIGVLPMMAFVGYLVAAIWVGEWILGQASRAQRRERPYLAAVVGVIVLSIVSFVPIVGGIVSFMGFGAIVLLMWRTLRHGGSGTEQAAPSAAAHADSGMNARSS